MGVRRGAWEQIGRGDVWRPGMIQPGAPALGMGEAMRARAGAYRVKGGAENAWLGVADGLLRGLAGFALKVNGVKNQQREAWEDAARKMREYEIACSDPSSGTVYDPVEYKHLVEARDRARAVYESWSTAFGRDVSVEELTFEDARDCMLATEGLPQKTVDQINLSTIMSTGALPVAAETEVR